MREIIGISNACHEIIADAIRKDTLENESHQSLMLVIASSGRINPVRLVVGLYPHVAFPRTEDLDREFEKFVFPGWEVIQRACDIRPSKYRAIRDLKERNLNLYARCLCAIYHLKINEEMLSYAGLGHS